MNGRYTLSALAVLCLGVLLLSGCRGAVYNWGWYEVLPTTPRGIVNLTFLLSGLWLSLSISVLSLLFSVTIGLLIALPGLSAKPGWRRLNRIYVELFRSIPLLVMILWVYYGLPVVLGLSLGPFAAGVVALSLCDSAFEAEIFRGGIQSIARGQTEAADALGFTYLQKMRHVVLPQAIRRILPPLAGEFISLIKDSSLLGIIAIRELTKATREVVTTSLQTFELWFVCALLYLILTFTLSMCVKYLERRMVA